MRRRLACALVMLAAPPVGAQVGHLPTRSPYRDLEFRQEVTLYSGYFAAAKDPAGAAPQGGPMAGARYDIRVGGPAWLYARVAHAQTERSTIDPFKPVAQRVGAPRSAPVMLTDLGLALNLTGQKSYHRLVPVLSGGAGVATDFHRRVDLAGYRFGTTFALSYGVGLKWVPGGRLQARLDAGNYLYQIKYPELYYRVTDSIPSVVPQNQAKSFWKNNGAVTFGLSYLFFR